MANSGNDKSVKWEQRWHPLRREWVVLAAHRNNRPWSGEEMDTQHADVPHWKEDCYLCPRNGRVSGAQNPDYTGVYVFDNDHPCVGELAPDIEANAPADVYKRTPAKGTPAWCVGGPEHHLRLGQLSINRVTDLLRCWQDQYRDLAAQPDINHVLIFENNGEAVGVSNPHPHCQIYATNFVFKTTEEEVRATQEWRQEQDGRLFDAIIKRLRGKDGGRIIAANEHALALYHGSLLGMQEKFMSFREPGFLPLINSRQKH